MLAEKFNFKTREYVPYVLPEGTKMTTDMEAVMPCADCGEELIYGESYTSRAIHNSLGFAYPVCKNCYEKELSEELTYAREGDV